MRKHGQAVVDARNSLNTNGIKNGKGESMRKLIYKIAQKMYFAHLIPWKVWSPIYDRYHVLFSIEDKY